jgi:hypothetical protein
MGRHPVFPAHRHACRPVIQYSGMSAHSAMPRAIRMRARHVPNHGFRFSEASHEYHSPDSPDN